MATSICCPSIQTATWHPCTLQMPRNSLSHSGCTSSKRSCQPVVVAVRQEADSPEGQRRPAGRGPERIRVKNLQQPLCLWGLHTCCNMDAEVMRLWLLFCYSIRSGVLRKSAELLQGHKSKHTASTSSTPSFERDQMFQLSPATSKGTYRKNVPHLSTQDHGFLDDQSLHRHLRGCGGPWSILSRQQMTSSNGYHGHTSLRKTHHLGEHDAKKFKTWYTLFWILGQKNSNLGAGTFLCIISSKNSHGALKTWLTNDHRSSYQDMLATHCIFSFCSF